jgi:hypothetical protein
MDVRNIKLDKEYISREEILDRMYELGKEQLEGYSKIESLPEYPLDVNSRTSQVMLKDFIGRVTEELSEGYDSTVEAVKIVNEVGWNIDILEKKQYDRLLNHLQNANEEQADAIGFFITLLLYSNILPEDIYSYINKESPAKEVNTLEQVMTYGVYMLSCINSSQVIERGFILFSKELAEDFEVNYDKVDSYTPGFHVLSPIKHSANAFLLWQVTHQLLLTRNLLKNRPWKQTQVMTKELEYQESLVISFIKYLGFLAINGFNPENLYELFHRKQKLNLWRMSTGY